MDGIVKHVWSGREEIGGMVERHGGSNRYRNGRCDMCVGKVLRVVLFLSVVFALCSCRSMRSSSDGENLLATGLLGWQQIEGDQGIWEFDDGVLYTDGGASGWLSTVRQYSDFVLSLEFRVPPEGNSGVFLRAPHEGNPAYSGMEIQILDDYAERYANLRPEQYTASIYDVQAPSDRTSRPAGEWQTMVITCNGPYVDIELNGEKVIDTDVRYYPYKLDTHPGLKRQRGYIGLQNHGSRIEFRNITIEELPDALYLW
jgi:hypothetical protein